MGGTARWPARQVLLAVLSVLALAVAGAGGYALAGAGTPGDASAEAGFARDMRDHHAQAVRMSSIIRDRTTDPQIRSLAFDIGSGQQAQLGMMMGWLERWGLPQSDGSRPPMAWMSPSHGGHGMAGEGAMTSLLPDGRMPGMAAEADLTGLEALSGRPAEVRWLQLMVAHHRGGVAMAQAALRLVGDPVERRLARSIVDSQTAEIGYLNELLGQRST